jgi:Tfp pilus assembly protein PilX
MRSKRNTAFARDQRGTTLIVALMMLLVITLLGIASIRMSGSSMMVVGNMQARKFTENLAFQAIEETMSSIAPFNDRLLLVQPAQPALVTISVSPRSCVFSVPATGYSAVAALTPEDNIWEFAVTVDDSLTGARTRMVQGAKIRQLAGACQ